MGSTYDLNDPDLRHFLSNTTLKDCNFFDERLIGGFCKDVGYDLNNGEKSQKDIT